MPLPPLILIHGYPFDHTMWKFVVAELEGKVQIITPDLPGFGDNPAENAEPSIDLMADDVAELFDLHHFKKAVIAGMSMGGYVALALAERHKNRVAGLGLISTQAMADTPEMQEGRRTLIAKVSVEGTKPAEALLPKLFSAAHQNNPEFERFAIEGAKNAGVEGITWALEAMARRPDRSALLRALKIPTLVFHGAEDKIIPVERARQLAETVAGAKYVEVPDVGHATPLESPRELAAALLSLLQDSEKFSHQLPDRDKHAQSLPGVTWAPSEKGL